MGRVGGTPMAVNGLALTGGGGMLRTDAPTVAAAVDDDAAAAAAAAAGAVTVSGLPSSNPKPVDGTAGDATIAGAGNRATTADACSNGC